LSSDGALTQGLQEVAAASLVGPLETASR